MRFVTQPWPRVEVSTQSLTFAHALHNTPPPFPLPPTNKLLQQTALRPFAGRNPQPPLPPLQDNILHPQTSPHPSTPSKCPSSDGADRVPKSTVQRSVAKSPYVPHCQHGCGDLILAAPRLLMLGLNPILLSHPVLIHLLPQPLRASPKHPRHPKVLH